MKVTVNVDCSPEEARRFLGLPDLTPVHDAYVEKLRATVAEGLTPDAVGIPGLLREKHGIARPLMLHLAGADHFVDAEAQKAMHEGLDDHPRVTLHDYPGEDHGFATESGKRRSEQAADLADSRTAAFFAEHLG